MESLSAAQRVQVPFRLAAFPGEGTYTIGDDPGGRVVCFEGGEPVAPVMWWTTDAVNVLASAAWEGHTSQELFEWWATEPGPVPSQSQSS